MKDRIRKWLFTARAGDLLLRALERWLDLALVPLDEIASQRVIALRGSELDRADEEQYLYDDWSQPIRFYERTPQ
jgi:hypothetical protein